MLSQDKFDSDFEVASKMAAETHKSMYKDVKKEIGWQLYLNSSNPGLGFHVFGRHVGTPEKWAQGNIGIDLFTQATNPGTGKPMWNKKTDKPVSEAEHNFRFVNDRKAGSILMMGSINWNFTINDCWLLGGVHAHLPFYPASPLSTVNIFNQDPNHDFTLTITGREFLGLLVGGYTLQEGNPSVGDAMICTQPYMADRLTLTICQNIVSEVEKRKKRQVVIEMASAAGISIN